MKFRKKEPSLSVTKTFEGQFPQFQRPSFTDTVRFPDNLTELTSSNISELHGKYTQLYAFANRELAAANIDILQLQTQISLRTNAIFRNNPAINSQERWKRDAVVEEDSDIETYNERISVAKRKRLLCEMARENFEKYINALSRELSRKGTEHARPYAS